MRPEHRIDPKIREMLEASGRDWRVEDGKKHLKLYLDDRMVCVLPTGRPSERWCRNTYAVRSRVRRLLQEEERQ